jgi:8-oxo-dGTP pyrophosphatase MutT (NUDIX family)
MAELKIRNRAAGLLMTPDKVLLHRLGKDDFWSLPGGGIEPGESAGAGMVRELKEELGWTPSQPPILIGLIENRFWLHERDHHEVGFYFLIDAEALWQHHGSPEVGVSFPGAESWITFAWFAREALAGMDIRPYLVKDWLIMPPQSLRHHVMGFSQG